MEEKNHNNERRSKLLDRLQEESWQLELIVSGIVIFLLIGLYPYLNEFGRYISTAAMGSSTFAGPITAMWSFVSIAYIALIGMFLLHLAVRGMWIGAIGLRSVSGEFDHDHLNYPARYGEFLRRRLGSFDDYIDRLERNASVTFSLAFLLFFAIFSLGLFFVTIVAVVLLFTSSYGSLSIMKESVGPIWSSVILFIFIAWLLLMVLAGLIYFIDFITFGWIKRRKWFGRVYYPVYRFLGWVTLARLYRPFYYNIIDNPFGKKLVRIYSALTFAGIILTTIQVTPFANFTYSRNVHGAINADQYLENGVYGKQNSLSYQYPSLAGRYASEDYLELFLPLFESKIKGALKHRFPELRPLSESSVGFMNRFLMSEQDPARVDSTLTALSAIHQVFLNDSLVTDVSWRFYEHPTRKQPGLRYDIPVYDLARGEYWVRVESQKVQKDTLLWEQIAYISFLR